MPSAEQLEHTAKWIPTLSSMWHEEIPIRMHMRAFDRSGNPEWHPDFANWLMGGGGQNSERRSRLTQAMRRLRKRSIREYEVAYRVIVLGEHVGDTTKWLNARAERNGKSDRYSVADTEVIICSAVDKLLAWY
jgi:hypothetical protein